MRRRSVAAGVSICIGNLQWKIISATDCRRQSSYWVTSSLPLLLHLLAALSTKFFLSLPAAVTWSDFLNESLACQLVVLTNLTNCTLNAIKSIRHRERVESIPPPPFFPSLSLFLSLFLFV